MLLEDNEWKKANAAKVDTLCKAWFRQALASKSTCKARVVFRLNASKGLENASYFLHPFSCSSKKTPPREINQLNKSEPLVTRNSIGIDYGC
ncbi:MAG: hypothetical protein L3J04_03045 [Robiginitomaculum sp.]|nr:hypothetical protein [Robiginitomaculum sp.]